MPAMELWEKRLLFSSTAGTLLAFLLQIIAVCTTNWFTFEVPGGTLTNDTGIPDILLKVQSGLWRICKTGYTTTNADGSGPQIPYDKCTSHNMFPPEEEVHSDDSINFQLLDFMRTGSAFGIISLLIMFLGHLFAVYTLRRPRYILKRLTALMHFMTAACVLVENEVFIRKVDHIEEVLPERLPEKAIWSYGYSFILSWFSFGIYLIAGGVFLFTSHKRKAEMSDTVDRLAEEDEPVAIRR